MSFDPSTVTVTELVTGMRAGAAGQYSSEAAIELLIRHWNWLAKPAFTRACVHAPHATPDVLTIVWPQLAWLLANLERPGVDLVLAAISHAAGTHNHVLHVGEPTTGGHGDQWQVTATSPRLRPGPLHPWPPPALPGLTDDTSTTD
jgi:hypothetical protein